MCLYVLIAVSSNNKMKATSRSILLLKKLNNTTEMGPLIGQFHSLRIVFSPLKPKSYKHYVDDIFSKPIKKPTR